MKYWAHFLTADKRKVSVRLSWYQRTIWLTTITHTIRNLFHFHHFSGSISLFSSFCSHSLTHTASTHAFTLPFVRSFGRTWTYVRSFRWFAFTSLFIHLLSLSHGGGGGVLCYGVYLYLSVFCACMACVGAFYCCCGFYSVSFLFTCGNNSSSSSSSNTHTYVSCTCKQRDLCFGSCVSVSTDVHTMSFMDACLFVYIIFACGYGSTRLDSIQVSVHTHVSV